MLIFQVPGKSENGKFLSQLDRDPGTGAHSPGQDQLGGGSSQSLQSRPQPSHSQIEEQQAEAITAT